MRNRKTIIFTDRSVNSVDLMLKGINKFPVLTFEQEYALWEEMQKGSQRARQKLINCNLRYVVSRAKQYLWCGLGLEDLFQTGSAGLTQAADKFDATLGVKFILFARYQIDAELHKAVTEQMRHKNMVSLDDAAYPGDDCRTTWLDILQSDEQQRADWNVRYESAFNAMKDKVRRRFWDEAADIWTDYLAMRDLGYTLGDVARKHNVTEERAKQLIKKISRDLSPDFSIAA